MSFLVASLEAPAVTSDSVVAIPKYTYLEISSVLLVFRNPVIGRRGVEATPGEHDAGGLCCVCTSLTMKPLPAALSTLTPDIFSAPSGRVRALTTPPSAHSTNNKRDACFGR